MKLSRIYYKYIGFVGDSDIIKYLSEKGLSISWVVEAGCHDGEDTLRINRSLRPNRIIAFEPDEYARLRAVKTYAVNNLTVELHPFGLSDKNSKMFLNFVNGVEGSGSTFLAESGNQTVEVKRLNDLNLKLNYGGMLWLDVEGHAVQALHGASDYLSNLRAAKIEVQMHDMSTARSADYSEVNKIMLSHGMIPVRAPVYPGFFGDVIFLNKKDLSVIDRIWSRFLIFQMKILHGLIYPLLRKPKW